MGDSDSGFQPPSAVNWHLEALCNYACEFCYATFLEQAEQPRLGEAEGVSLIRDLAAQGVEKINFVGGEPMLHPHINAYIREAKLQGMTTSIVSNGTKMTQEWLTEMKPHLDWLGLSIDASNDKLHVEMGRGLKGELTIGCSKHLDRCLEVLEVAIPLDYNIKLNTVVNRVNLHDDMTYLIALIEPDRWKVFQVLPIQGENDGRVESLLISGSEFDEYVNRHRESLAPLGIEVVAETNEQMLGTYAMIDPLGYAYTNHNGRYLYSKQSIVEVGFADAWAQVSEGFSESGFEDRGGEWGWKQPNPSGYHLSLHDEEVI